MSMARRVAFLSEHASPVALLGSEDAGGQNVYVDEVSRNLGQLGWEVDVFTRRDNAQAPEVIAWAPGVRVVNLAVGAPTFLLKDQLWPLMPDFRDAFLAFMEREGRGYDLIHGNFWMSGWVAAEVRRLTGIPAVHIFHAMGKTKRRHQQGADTSPDERIAVELAVIRGVDRLVAQCPSEYEELVQDYDTDPAKVVIIPSAVNVARFRPVPQAEARARIGLDPHELVVVYVGRMIPRKGVRNVVRGVARLLAQYGEALPPVRLLLVGGESAEPDPQTTPEIQALQTLATDLGILHRVTFTGKRQPDTLRDYYSAGDVAVTTPWYEPFGLTPLEAMACGTPVIGSAVGGIPFTVADGETGFLVPPEDPGALAERLFLVLQDATLRRKLGQAARTRVEQEFTWRTVAVRTAALYHQVLAGAPAGVPALSLPVPVVV